MNHPHAASPANPPVKDRLIPVDLDGQIFKIYSNADMEALWEEMDEESVLADERLPYWAEIWPSGIALCRRMMADAASLLGARVLDLGCGLGLTSLVAASLGAFVVAVDYEPRALDCARVSQAKNSGKLRGDILWTLMDWRAPAVAAHAFDLVLGGDIIYEKRFFRPLAGLFSHVLAPGGRIWLTEPGRQVAQPAWDFFRDAGFDAAPLARDTVRAGGPAVTVTLHELRMRDGQNRTDAAKHGS